MIRNYLHIFINLKRDDVNIGILKIIQGQFAYNDEHHGLLTLLWSMRNYITCRFA